MRFPRRSPGIKGFNAFLFKFTDSPAMISKWQVYSVIRVYAADSYADKLSFSVLFFLLLLREDVDLYMAGMYKKSVCMYVCMYEG